MAADDETPKHERRASGGGSMVYDPARDRWEDRSGDRDNDEAWPQQQQLLLHRVPDLTAPSPAGDNYSQVHRASYVDAGNLTAPIQQEQPLRQHSPTVTSPSPFLPTKLSTEPSISDEKTTHTVDKSKKTSKTKTMSSPISQEAYRPEADDAIASPGPAGDSPNDKKRKLTEEEPSDKPKPSGPVSKRKRQEERHQKLRKRGRAPPSAYSRRDADEHAAANRDAAARRSPSIPRAPSPEPPRQRKRPGGGSRMGLVNSETLRRRQEERERAQEQEAMRHSQNRGLTDVVRQHYNAVPQRGREWRKTESKIKGLRSFNNWVKSTVIQKFSPDEEFVARHVGTKDWADGIGPPPVEERRLLVIDLGCGKGGDLGKWQLAPQPVDLYVGLDPADISIAQAQDRYNGMRSGRGSRGRRNPIFHAEFSPKDCFGDWLGDIPIVQQVGIDPNAGPGGSAMASRWGGGGFDVVVSMFAIHYAFESEEKTRQMLRNVAGCLKKGGRFLGVCPNSDVISGKVAEYNQKRKERETTKKQETEAPEDGEVEEENKAEWGNSIYRVKFPGTTPEDGVFRPPFGWRYSYFMEEAVGEIPEYVVPWEAFRALTEDYNLELQYRKPFLEVWRDEKDDPELGPLSERMGVRDRNSGDLLMTEEEQEAASFYHAFCFYKV
ncbi:hypothetical protein ASPWEDRAFT_46085 [Aspergillus wentii DTO 134E9]|uniref:mRNA cap guanine-N(7) methyltransferase n=1 Tax=Aspergillus wentii DTO 134E9 TaxID=1073089 RepID=A0A1L9R6E6_ASPWE|nr:uncharacterized protein ASPWEDRAFT_46085 [Aspergillus wentii DTO 134E9]KAI9926850.1 mRNA cap guanine-N7 methyltransferase [Aspergillus wentii]OJJ30480.1 hypothetical protein ASPWEDRAFT_46085 [Aspergillus wentii DTO 134E9]